MGSLNLMNLGLNWRLAMQRLNKDIRDDFWPDPLGLRDVLGSPDVTMARLDPILRAYRPNQGNSYGIPKPGFTIRDSVQIAGLDRLVYQALIDQLIPHIDPFLAASVYSHRLRSPPSKWIFQSSVGQWKAFRRAVKEAIMNSPNSYLVVADIAQYFESIRFRTLRRQIEQLLGSEPRERLRPCVDALFNCLEHWTPYDGYGLPQNVDASSFLGNLFLDYVDKMMAREGFCMFRYMDDLRLVVPSEAHARKAIVRLVGLLRELGLGLNTAKTQILDPECEQFREHLLPDDPEVAEIEAAIGQKNREAVQGVVGILFQKTSTLITQERLGDRIFRFCINRIASLRGYRNLDMPDGQDITDTILHLLVRRPAETDTFCRYLEVAPLTQRHEQELERLLVTEPLTVYPWQNFLLWRLISHRGVTTAALTNKAHALLSNEPQDPETAGAALYLGRHGDYADRHAIAKLLPTASKGFFRRSYQVAIQELHKAERSRVYKETAQEDEEAALLGDHLAGLQEPIYVQDAPEISIEDLPDAMPSVYA